MKVVKDIVYFVVVVFTTLCHHMNISNIIESLNYCNTSLYTDYIFADYKSAHTYALRAPPPLACPSSFVIITDATSTFSLKALA